MFGQSECLRGAVLVRFPLNLWDQQHRSDSIEQARATAWWSFTRSKTIPPLECVFRILLLLHLRPQAGIRSIDGEPTRDRFGSAQAARD
jgi:hypothetical protein